MLNPDETRPSSARRGFLNFISIVRSWPTSSMLRSDWPANRFFNVLPGNRFADPDDAARYPDRNFAYRGVIWEADERDG